MSEGASPQKWQRDDFQLGHPDRLWLYANAKEPVLDVGCGTAVDAREFKEYVGLDVTPAFLHSAKFDYGVKNLIMADGRALPFRDKSFETVWSKDVVIHYLYDDMKIFLAEHVRVGKRAYVAWGTTRSLESYAPKREGRARMNRLGFWFTTHDKDKLDEDFRISKPFEGTSITEVNKNE